MGGSMLVGPMGDVLAAAAGNETVLMAEVDPTVVGSVRAELPLADRKS